MIMYYVHVHSLVPACKESLSVLLLFNAVSDTRKHQSPRIYSLQVSSWHLQY